MKSILVAAALTVLAAFPVLADPAAADSQHAAELQLAADSVSELDATVSCELDAAAPVVDEPVAMGTPAECQAELYSCLAACPYAGLGRTRGGGSACSQACHTAYQACLSEG